MYDFKMKPIDEPPLEQCRQLVDRANPIVIQYFGLPNREFRVSYSPPGEGGLKQKVETALGTCEVEIRASGGRHGITFHEIPTEEMAEHELVHAYHFSINQLVTRIQDWLVQLKPDQAISLKDYMLYALIPQVTYEAVAYGFNSRNKEGFGLVHRHSNNDPDSVDTMDSLREVEAMLLEYARIPPFSVTQLENLLRKAKDGQNTLDEIIKTLRAVEHCMLQIGNYSGSLMLAQPNAEPLFNIKVDKEARKMGMGIFFQLVPVPDRQRILKEMFEMDVMTLSMRCIELHRERLDPLLREGYRLLAEKFKQEYGL